MEGLGHILREPHAHGLNWRRRGNESSGQAVVAVSELPLLCPKKANDPVWQLPC